ncbi:MAG TPA: MFS transporter [Acetobacteraceae bacterium]|nr:MFS transporter [Acetobacteraceae bacterium]
MTRLPRALAPLRHTAYRRLWAANVVTSLGLWLQNTGAGWLMTSLAPVPLIVALVQVATILPSFALSLPGGALADIVDRRRFLIGTQLWMMASAGLLAALTLLHLTTAWGLLALTFAIGIGGALTAPAWSAIIPDLVPRGDLVQAIALGGIGFNLARALGPALAGALVLLGGAGLAFALYAGSFIAVISALVAWRGRRRTHRTALPREHLISAMRAGTRFVRNTPLIQNAMLRCFAFALPASAPWALLPLVVREQLGLGAGMFGLILGLMGAGGVTSGLLMPRLARLMSRGAMVFTATLASCAGMAMLGLARHWGVAGAGMALFGTGWVAAFAMTQATAQLVCPPWVRARALGIYQLSFNGALTLGSVGWGWLGGRIGMSAALLAAAALGAALAIPLRAFALDTPPSSTPREDACEPAPEAPAAELAPVLARGRDRVLETRQYRVAPGQRDAFLMLMAEIRQVRRRAGAVSWDLYEDVAHPEGFLEAWSMENWTDHLREEARMSPGDRTVLAKAASFQTAGLIPARFIAVDPVRIRGPAPAGAQSREARCPAPDAIPYGASTERRTP